jgi:hypothetical protein
MDMPHVISVKMYLRLHGAKASIIYNDNRWHLIMPPWTLDNYIDFTLSGREIKRLIKSKLLVPDIYTKKEYRIQKALGVADGRVYRLRKEVAANYIISRKERGILADIEYLPSRYDYRIMLMDSGWRTNIYEEGKVKTYYLLDKDVVESLIEKGIIVKMNQYVYTLSDRYWNFNL